MMPDLIVLYLASIYIDDMRTHIYTLKYMCRNIHNKIVVISFKVGFSPVSTDNRMDKVYC